MTAPTSTPEHLAARTRRALAAATAAGRALGLAVDEPKLLHDAFSVVVHLAPSPVVVRAPVVLPPGFSAEAQRARQARELDVVAWLADRRCPVVRPSPLVAREPVQRDGLSLTFWEYVDVIPSGALDYVEQAGLVPALHAALGGYPRELPFMAPVTTLVPACLDVLDANPGLLAPIDLDRAQNEWRVLGPLLTSRTDFDARFPHAGVQTLHGDAPSYNLLRTSSGPRYADFEDVTLGPPEWDLALLGPESVNAYDAAASAAGVRRLDPELLRVMDACRMLQLVACMALVSELPMLESALAPSLQSWCDMPFAGGLA